MQVHLCAHVHACRRTHADDRGQLAWADSLLPACGLRSSNVVTNTLTQLSHLTSPSFCFWRSSSIRYRTLFLFPLCIAPPEGTQDPVYARHVFPPWSWTSIWSKQTIIGWKFLIFFLPLQIHEITHCLWNSKIPDDKSDNLTGDLLHVTNGFFLASLAFLSVSYWILVGVSSLWSMLSCFWVTLSTSGSSTLPPPFKVSPHSFPPSSPEISKLLTLFLLEDVPQNS